MISLHHVVGSKFVAHASNFRSADYAENLVGREFGRSGLPEYPPSTAALSHLTGGLNVEVRGSRSENSSGGERRRVNVQLEPTVVGEGEEIGTLRAIRVAVLCCLYGNK